MSPGSPKGGVIARRCPTFSWGEVENAASYELVVYRVRETEGEAEPVWRKAFAGSVHSWTPSLDRCLERGGRYAWNIRAVLDGEPSEWSRPSLFQVSLDPSGSEVQHALELLSHYLAKRGELEESSDSTPSLLDPLLTIGPNDPVGLRVVLDKSSTYTVYGGYFDVYNSTFNHGAVALYARAGGLLPIPHFAGYFDGPVEITDWVTASQFIDDAFSSYSGGYTLCSAFPSSGAIGRCSSSRRLKSRIEDLSLDGTEILAGLRPVEFVWTESGERDFGFVAEEVAEVDPLLVHRDDYGRIADVRYRQMAAILVQVLQRQAKEQRDQAQRYEQSLHELEGRLESLEKRSRPPG